MLIVVFSNGIIFNLKLSNHNIVDVYEIDKLKKNPVLINIGTGFLKCN